MFKNKTSVKHGICRHVDDDGGLQECMYINDQMNGFGRQIWPNGRFYMGNFKNGIFHGQGMLGNPNGQFETGFYENGKLKKWRKIWDKSVPFWYCDPDIFTF